MKSLWAFLFATSLFLFGSSTSSRAEYHIGFLNKTGRRLDSVGLYFNNKKVVMRGFLVKGGQSTYGSLTQRLPSEAEVRWDDNGKRHAVKFKLRDVVPNSVTRDGIIYFVINENSTVDVKPIKWGDDNAWAELVKGLRPKGEYRLGFINKTGRDLSAVSAYYGEQKVGVAGDLPMRVKVGYSDPLEPPNPLRSRSAVG